jgi:hypothetical protein
MEKLREQSFFQVPFSKNRSYVSMSVDDTFSCLIVAGHLAQQFIGPGSTTNALVEAPALAEAFF